jgi:serine/threonine protein kinase
VRTGQVIAGRYRLQEQVGSGGMGVVWRARDEEQGPVVALKRSIGEVGMDDERTRRQLRREARIAAELHHPHIVEFFGEVGDGREQWIVMEYVPSKSLAQMLDRHRTLPPRYVTHIGAQIASALQAVHVRDILHRDVKPGKHSGHRGPHREADGFRDRPLDLR